MSNKHFFGFIVLVLAVLFGWMVYDMRNDSNSVGKEGGSRDFLIGTDGSTAQIQYLFHFMDPVYSHSLDTGQIEVLSRKEGEAEHYHVYGLTQASYKMDALYEFNWSKAWFKDEYSMWVENLRVDFSYNTMNVYVTSNYAEGACEYGQTLDHENQHVQIHRQVYFQYQKILQQVLGDSKEIPLPSRPILVHSKEEGKEKVGKIISGVIDPVFDRFRDALAAEQAKIDTPDNYAALRSKCDHW